MTSHCNCQTGSILVCNGFVEYGWLVKHLLASDIWKWRTDIFLSKVNFLISNEVFVMFINKGSKLRVIGNFLLIFVLKHSKDNWLSTGSLVSLDYCFSLGRLKICTIPSHSVTI